MRFMVMHKLTDEMERGVPPDPATMERIGKLIEACANEGIFVSGEGLKPSSQRTRIAYENGRRTVTEGPFSDAEELVAGFLLVRVRSKEEAIAWCDSLAAIVGDVQIFMGPVVEPWDLGMTPKPSDPPLRFLAMPQLREGAGDRRQPDPARMGALIDEMKQAGVLDAAGSLTGTRDGARLRGRGAQRAVIDGPFAESKELVAGYAILELPSKAAAIEWATRFGDAVDVHEIDIRLMHEP